jgi:hypothetical protein
LSSIVFNQRYCGDPGLSGAPQILADTKAYKKINNVTQPSRR